MANYNDFIWFVPKTPTTYMVSLTPKGRININPALRKLLPDKIDIGYDSTRKRIAIRVEDGKFNLPKNGSIRNQEIIQTISKSGLSIPVRFYMQKDDGLWVGNAEEQLKTFPGKNAPKRKSKPDLQSLIKEVQKL